MADILVKEGGLVGISVTFTNLSGTPTDPTTVTFTWSVVDEATRSVTVAGASYPNGDSHITHTGGTGVYEVDIDTTNLPGLLLWKFVGTGAVEQVWDGQLVIRKTAV